jgi:REP element-mobilizing transposase RayT
MTFFNPDIHHRRSIRLRDYDYASAGAYFVTICTQGRECLFGGIDGETMVFNEAGHMVETVWRGLPDRFPGVDLDTFVVMPNHVHFIVFLVGAVLAPPCSSAHAPPPEAVPLGKQGAASSAPTKTPTLGSIVRAFKSISAIEVNRLLERQGQPLWQRNYYERVIRDDGELHGFREYIHYNPARWADDENNEMT